LKRRRTNPAGYGLQVCTLDLHNVAEARVIVTIPEVCRGLEPFAALGRRLAEADGDAPLITDACAKLDITVGDLQRIAAVYAKMFPPEAKAAHGRRRAPGWKLRPKGRAR
jgi:hypothetical protein